MQYNTNTPARRGVALQVVLRVALMQRHFRPPSQRTSLSLVGRSARSRPLRCVTRVSPQSYSTSKSSGGSNVVHTHTPSGQVTHPPVVGVHVEVLEPVRLGAGPAARVRRVAVDHGPVGNLQLAIAAVQQREVWARAHARGLALGGAGLRLESSRPRRGLIAGHPAVPLAAEGAGHPVPRGQRVRHVLRRLIRVVVRLHLLQRGGEPAHALGDYPPPQLDQRGVNVGPDGVPRPARLNDVSERPPAPRGTAPRKSCPRRCTASARQR